jgi:hypothetical protein
MILIPVMRETFDSYTIQLVVSGDAQASGC